MTEDKFGSGSISNQGGFKYSTPQERFTRQLERDIKRDRLSQSTLRKLITDDTAQWARNIYAEKTAKNAAINVLNTQNQSKQTVGAVTEFGGRTGGDASASVTPISAGASSAPVEFEGGGGEGDGCVGLNLYNRSGSVWVGAGTVNSISPQLFDPINGMQVASSGQGYVWLEITTEETYSTATIKEVTMDHDFSVPEDEKIRYVLGYYRYSGGNPEIANYGCGSIWASFCRNWFVAEPPYFSISFIRSV